MSNKQFIGFPTYIEFVYLCEERPYVVNRSLIPICTSHYHHISLSRSVKNESLLIDVKICLITYDMVTTKMTQKLSRTLY